MNRSQQLIILLEGIAGNAAIVYHRTGSKPFIDPATGKKISGRDIPKNILKQGFAEGAEGMYGPGIYATYKLDSQFRESMSTYGKYLIKCRVNLQGYIILEYAEAKKVYRQAYPLRDQLSQYYSPQWLDEKSEWLEKYHQQLMTSPNAPTSHIAADLHTHYLINSIVPGMLFLGQRDDAVVVTYKPEYILPVEYAYHPVGTNTPVRWTAFRAVNYTGHLRKVGTLIRHVPGRKTGSGFSELFRKLGARTRWETTQIVDRLRRLQSLSLEDTTPVVLPPQLLALARQKFQHPEPEVYALVRPVVEQWSEKITQELCQTLQHIFPEIRLECRVLWMGTTQFTLTFPTLKAVLTFTNHIALLFPQSHPFSEFLRLDRKESREHLMKSLFGLFLSLPEVKELAQEYLRFPLEYYFDIFLDLIQHAPATK